MLGKLCSEYYGRWSEWDCHPRLVSSAKSLTVVPVSEWVWVSVICGADCDLWSPSEIGFVRCTFDLDVGDLTVCSAWCVSAASENLVHLCSHDAAGLDPVWWWSVVTGYLDVCTAVCPALRMCVENWCSVGSCPELLDGWASVCSVFCDVGC